jgi:hypothetical protein
VHSVGDLCHCPQACFAKLGWRVIILSGFAVNSVAASGLICALLTSVGAAIAASCCKPKTNPRTDLRAPLLAAETAGGASRADGGSDDVVRQDSAPMSVKAPWKSTLRSELSRSFEALDDVLLRTPSQRGHVAVAANGAVTGIN